MNNIRKYGQPPYTLVVVHGGPGAPGEMKPVAQKLSSSFGVLEPLQTADSVDGQISELKSAIADHAHSPVVLIGWSWGAWLSLLVAAQYPKLVQKLILVSSGPFEAHYAQQIMPTRTNRLLPDQKKAVEHIFARLEQGSLNDDLISTLAELMDKADCYDTIAIRPANDLPFQPHIYQQVWKEAESMRKSGQLLEFGKKIECPVVAIHGDHDPHPWQGVKEPLSKVVKDFKFILLKHCGHHPWFEQEAKDEFYKLLQQEIFDHIQIFKTF